MYLISSGAFLSVSYFGREGGGSGSEPASRIRYTYLIREGSFFCLECLYGKIYRIRYTNKIHVVVLIGGRGDLASDPDSRIRDGILFDLVDFCCLLFGGWPVSYLMTDPSYIVLGV